MTSRVRAHLGVGEPLHEDRLPPASAPRIEAGRKLKGMMAMRNRDDTLAHIERALPELCATLLEEQAQASDVPDGANAQWALFRALVNTRPPAPAPDGFLERQGALLQDILAYRGVTRLEDIPQIEGNPNIRLWRGDITTLATDAIVNAANSQMLGCFVPGHHCIDNAIHTFAGVQLRLECARLMGEQGYPEPTGMAKTTDAFNLPSAYVIHTVGPIAEGCATEADKALLANCYASCLDAAANARCRSIAFCCISTGAFGFPQDEAATIAVNTVRKWLDSHDADIEVVFNVFTERDYRLYWNILDTLRQNRQDRAL